jgi:hypothetical protein
VAQIIRKWRHTLRSPRVKERGQTNSAEGVARVHLPSKHEALGSVLSVTKRKRKGNIMLTQKLCETHKTDSV